MLRLVCLVLAIPVALVAQTSTSKPAAPAPRPAAPTTSTVKPATPSTAKPAAPARPAARPSTTRPAIVATPAPTPPPPLVTEDEKVIYALGLLMQRSLSQFDLSLAELDIVKRALGDAAAGKPAVEIDEFGPKIDPLVRVRRERVTMREKAASVAYLATAAAEAGAMKTASGLVYRELTAGTGPSPSAADMVRVNYRGTLVNGTEFDSSYKRNEPAEFALRGVIGCWTEGVQRMKVGGKARLVCPSDIAYGDAGSPPIPPGATLIFEIELLAIVAR